MKFATLLLLLLHPPAQQSLRLGDISDSIEEVAVHVRPAVVQILASGYSAGRGLVPSGQLVSEQRSRGSGVILSADGYIVTNAHVIEGARRVRVQLPRSGSETGSVLRPRGRVQGAQVVGVDEETDLAVLKIEAKELPYLTLGDSDLVRAGEIVLAFGSPLGFQDSVTMGVVSSAARQLTPEAPMIYLQTDASINPGNSGGPLVDSEGRVVGINTLIVSQSGGNEGLGFAAPSNIVRNVFEQLRTTGTVRRGAIGVRAQTITPLLSEGLGLSRDWGVILADVVPGGPAAEGGLEPGDIVLSIDGKPVENGRQLAVNIYQHRVGDTISLERLRGDEIAIHRVKVTERRESPNRFAGRVHPDRNLVPRLGILGIDLDPELTQMFARLRRAKGVIVAARAVQASPWEGEGLLPGDVIYAVNRADVGSLDGLKDALSSYAPGDPIVLLVERGGFLSYVTVELY